MDGMDILEELAKWLFSIWILGAMAMVTLLIYAIITSYPREFCIGLFIFGVTACVRFDLLKEGWTVVNSREIIAILSWLLVLVMLFKGVLW